MALRDTGYIFITLHKCIANAGGHLLLCQHPDYSYYFVVMVENLIVTFVLSIIDARNLLD